MEFTAEQLQEVIEFSVAAHKGVLRKGNGMPYIFHPFRVASKLITVKESTHLYLLVAACLLHDTVEDVEEITLQTIIDKFGIQVAAIVEELTLDKTKYETMGKTEYLSEHLLKMSSWALTIKLCDRWDNVEDMSKMDNEFKYKYKKETQEILKVLVEKRGLTGTQHQLVQRINLELQNYPGDKQDGLFRSGL